MFQYIIIHKRHGTHNKELIVHTHALPCVETLEWILQQINNENMIFKSIHGASLASYTPGDIIEYYNIPQPRDYLSTKWYCDFMTPTKDVIKLWWKEPGKFRQKPGGVYKTKALRKVYQLLMSI